VLAAIATAALQADPSVVYVSPSTVIVLLTVLADKLPPILAAPAAVSVPSTFAVLPNVAAAPVDMVPVPFCPDTLKRLIQFVPLQESYSIPDPYPGLRLEVFDGPPPVQNRFVTCPPSTAGVSNRQYKF
jgi:hypothetical protein